MTFEALGMVNIVSITVIAYLVGVCIKNIDFIDDKWIPVSVGITGGVLGAIAKLIGMPDFPASDMITAIAIGIASGFSATAINQLKKQLTQ